MSRTPVNLRDAVIGDIPDLVALWAPVMRRADAEALAEDLAIALADCAADPGQRIVVAELDGRFAGAAHLRATTISPINLEPVVHVVAPHAVPDLRRHGVGTALLEAAAAFAEEHGVTHVAAGAVAGSREGNRFLARLGLAQFATVRVAPLHVLRSRLASRRRATVSARPSASARPVGRPVAQVVEARRSQRHRSRQAT